MGKLNDENLELFYEAAFFILCGCLLMIHLLCSCACSKKDYSNKYTNQTTDVWNISGRVNHQDGAITSEPSRWPTHEHHINMDSFVIPDQGKDRLPPPPYSEVDLPSYEQATGTPKPKTDIVNVHMASSSSRNLDGPSS